MSLSKARDAERKRLARAKNVQPNLAVVQPKPDWQKNPNQYLLGHLSVCPDYEPVSPGDHFEHCPYVNPLIRLDTRLN